jgi:hypothetical protein
MAVRRSWLEGRSLTTFSGRGDRGEGSVDFEDVVEGCGFESSAYSRI